MLVSESEINVCMDTFTTIVRLQRVNQSQQRFVLEVSEVYDIMLDFHNNKILIKMIDLCKTINNTVQNKDNNFETSK